MWNIQLPPAEWYDRTTVHKIIEDVGRQKQIAIDTETTGLTVWKDIPLFWSMSWGERRMCLPADTLPMFQQIFAEKNRQWILANAKYDMHILANVGIQLAGDVVDIQIQHALLYEDEPHGLKYIANAILGWKWLDFQDTFKFRKGKKGTGEKVGDMLLRVAAENRDLLSEYASNDAYGTYKAFEKLDQELKDTASHSLFPDLVSNLHDYFHKIEKRFTRTLWKCERRGVLVDFNYLNEREQLLDENMADIEKQMMKEAGKLFNPDSDDDLRAYFFDHLKMAPLRMTSGGKSGQPKGSVDKAFMAYASEKGVQMATLCLRHSRLSTIKNTYLQGWRDRADPQGRLHTRFNQDVARSGRLSSSDPNLQNVKRPDEEDIDEQDAAIDLVLRAAFVPPEGFRLLVSDYEQLEMRLLGAATVSDRYPNGEENMIAIFREKRDIHMGNAAMVFGVPYKDIEEAKGVEKQIKKGKLPESALSAYHHQCLFYRQAAKAIGFG